MKDRYLFRVWDKNREKYDYFDITELTEVGVWYDGITDAWSVMYDAISDNNAFVLEQCAGQKDENGKLIYEGDILRGEETGDYGETLSIWHGVVMLNEEKHRLMIKDDIGDWYELDDFMFEDLAGNIHDNPELLEVAK